MIHLLPGTESPDAASERRLPRGWPLVAFSTCLFLALTVWITWPLAARIDRQFAGDLGDPLFVAWVMTWVMSHLTRALTGDAAALDRLWDANIFYPEPNTLALSEHFVGQSVQMLPIWWITGNPILAYNLSVFAAFVLTGVGTMFLTRAFTGGFAAPLLAGVTASFNAYRLGPEVAHLHVLSIQWLPFAMLGLNRYIATGSHGWLAATGAFVLALNLSSGYFMMFSAPFLALFAVADLAIQRRLGDFSRWAGLTIAAICVALITTPFVLPYVDMQRRLGYVRPLGEIILHSATFEAYRIYVLPWAGIPLALAGVAVAGLAARRPPTRRAYTCLMLAFLVLAMWLSLGPVVQPFGVPGPYALLYAYVPGFDGLRVVHRYGALFLVFLSVLAGIGAMVVRRLVRYGAIVVLGLTAAFLWQTWPAAFPLNVALTSVGLEPPPAYLEPASRLPGIYVTVQGLDADAVIAELPFADHWYNLRYQYFAGLHRRRLMNGYSGVFPPSFLARQRALAEPLATPESALEALGPATHVIVHEAAWADDTGLRIVALLEAAGATRVATVDRAHLLALRDLVRNAHAEARPEKR